MSSKVTIVSYTLLALCFTTSVAAFLDTRAYRKAVDEALQFQKSPAQEKARTAVVADIDLFNSCIKLEKPEGTLNTAVRGCLLDSMPKVTSVVGADAFAVTSYFWLKEHPEDVEIRQEAMRTIDIGWMDLRNSMPTYDLLEKVSRENERSFVMRLKDGRDPHRALFDEYADLLEQAEVGIMLPELRSKQVDRRHELQSKFPNL